MQNLIEGLLTLSRVTTKGQDFVPVDLAAVAAEVVSDLEAQIEQTQGRVDVGHLADASRPIPCKSASCCKT